MAMTMTTRTTRQERPFSHTFERSSVDSKLSRREALLQIRRICCSHPGIRREHLYGEKMRSRALCIFFLVALVQITLEEYADSRGILSNIFQWRASTTTTTMKPYTLDKSCECVCGERNDESRIVGGEATLSNEFPWMVRLSYFNRFYCGGMLINDKYVLTAAHCVRGFVWIMIKITLGVHDSCVRDSKPETRFAIRAFLGDFSYTSFDHDIALLRLNDRVPLSSEMIRPICLPSSPDDKYEGAKGIATGWGTLKENGKTSCTLQEVELPVMSNEECRTNTSYSAKVISDNMMCAGYEEGLKDSCQGDSGGPLIRERSDKKYELIGIVSWGNGCARPGNPGVYTRVNRYLEWIKSNSNDGCFCKE